MKKGTTLIADDMINVYLSEDKYRYDIYSLIKAFYPEEDINVNIADALADNAPFIGALFYCVQFDDNQIVISSGKYNCETIDNLENLEKSILNINEYSDKDVKNAFKRVLYDCIKKSSGKDLPWGILTGIRPTKLIMNLLKEGKSEDEIIKTMGDEYYVSKEKTILGINIASLEIGIIDSALCEDSFSLYVGIPFCPTTCMYCSFTSYPIASWKDKVDAYVEVLKHELDETSKIMSGKKLISVYIGGGTPTTLSEEQFKTLICHMKEVFDFSFVKEITVECGRPDSITEGKLKVLKELGVTRISVNPQTMNDDTLRLIGRRHSVDQVKEAFKLARDCGFDNINMDLILGLPGENEMHVRRTMEEIELLSPDSVTVHSLAMKRAAKMHSFLEEHPEYDSIISDEMLKLVYDYADKMEMSSYYLYRQKNMTGNYENVGYAKDGKYGLYNILIMEEVQSIVACGAGTITKRVSPGDDGSFLIERCDNVKDVKLYMEKIDEMIERKRQLFS